MPITVVCSDCGMSLNCPDSAAGKQGQCPRCKKVMPIPEVPEGEIGEIAPPCPSCGVPMAKDARLCVKCGFDTRTGGKLESFRPDPNEGMAIDLVADFTKAQLASGVELQGSKASSRDEAEDEDGPDDESGEHKKRRLAPHLAFGLIAWAILMPFLFTQMGLFALVVQQVLILLCALGLVLIPLLGSIAGDFREMEDFYEKNPRYLRVSFLLYRLIPILNYYLLRRELKVMLRILLAGLPMALLLQLVFTYAVPVPRWGLSKDMALLDVFLIEALWTIVFTPFTVMIVLGIKTLLPSSTYDPSTGAASGWYALLAWVVTLGLLGMVALGVSIGLKNMKNISFKPGADWPLRNQPDSEGKVPSWDMPSEDARKAAEAEAKKREAAAEERRANAEAQLRLEGAPTQWCGMPSEQRSKAAAAGGSTQPYDGCGKAVPRGSTSCPFCGAKTKTR